MEIKTEKEYLIEELNRTNKLLEEATLNYFDMCMRVDELEKCLDEIEEICKVHTNFCKDNKKNCELCPHEPCEDIIILQKIKEVKGNE